MHSSPFVDQTKRFRIEVKRRTHSTVLRLRPRGIAAAALLGVLAAACSMTPLGPQQPLPLALRSAVQGADGTTIATLFEENRIAVGADDVPELVRNAVVAVEDARFFEHGAIDTRALVRALVANVEAGRAAQGGSTITQQLAKLMYTAPNSTRDLETKVRETRLALNLEREYTKEQILAMYLNRAFFGAGAYGITAAAETYFNKPLAKLTIGEAAMLAGLIRAPTSLDPFTNPRGAKARRTFVVRRMLEERMITAEDAQAAISAPLKLRKRSSNRFANYRFPYVVQHVENEFLTSSRFGKTEDVRADKLYTGGLTVRSTIVPKWQTFAEQAVATVLPESTDPEAALVAIDPKTGRIKAMVGGRDFFADQYNIATQGRRQPGSAFKPFVLAAALEKGISPNARYASDPVALRLPNGETWNVNNYDGAGHGVVTLREGMKSSINGVYARLVMDVGATRVADVARRAGITSKLDAYPSIALGGLTYGVTPLEMASAYATFASNGVYRRPHSVLWVKDASGKVLFSDGRLKGKQTINAGVAYTVTSVLQEVACCGTARRAGFGRPLGAKTGTTEERKDVWLVGYTPDLVTAVWVGYRQPKRMRYLRGQQVYGGTIGAAIWREFMSRALASTPPHDFTRAALKPSSVDGVCEAGSSSGTETTCPSATPSPSPSQSPARASVKPSPKATPKPSATSSPKSTPTSTPSPKPSPTSSPSSTSTPRPSSTSTPSPSPTTTSTSTPTPSATPSSPRSGTPSPSPTLSASSPAAVPPGEDPGG